MNGGDYWHVARSQESSSQRAMISSLAALRFRPIAPKPIARGDFTGDKASLLPATSKRVKRKYVRVRKDDDNPRRKRKEMRSKGKDRNTVTETAKVKEEGRSEGVVDSQVTVDHVTNMCMEERLVCLGCTDAERVKNLECDTCPGFVSDGYMGRVEWVNEAYQRMVAGGHVCGGGRWPEILVRLVIGGDCGTRDKIRSCTDEDVSFTCLVRVEYYYYLRNNNNNNKEKKYWKVMPCDVWRLDSGGLAWRLDAKAALSLGL